MYERCRDVGSERVRCVVCTEEVGLFYTHVVTVVCIVFGVDRGISVVSLKVFRGYAGGVWVVLLVVVYRVCMYSVGRRV